METIVSVIIPTCNRPLRLQKAVQSVLQQTYPHFEIIIVDDASKTAMPNFNDPEQRIRIITNKTKLGGSGARNRGIVEARGRYIAFLDDDDTWQPTKLECQLNLLAQFPDAVAATAAYTVHYPFRIKRQINPPKNITFDQLLENNVLGGASVCLCDAETIKNLCGFDEHLLSGQDWDLWLKLLSRGDIVTVKSPQVNYYVHLNSRISNNMQSKYKGARRFYFKYKPLLTETARRQHLTFIAFIKSRQRERRFSSRLRHLLLALQTNQTKQKWRYLLSSLPRMLIRRA